MWAGPHKWLDVGRESITIAPLNFVNKEVCTSSSRQTPRVYHFSNLLHLWPRLLNSLFLIAALVGFRLIFKKKKTHFFPGGRVGFTMVKSWETINLIVVALLTPVQFPGIWSLHAYQPPCCLLEEMLISWYTKWSGAAVLWPSPNKRGCGIYDPLYHSGFLNLWLPSYPSNSNALPIMTINETSK